MAESPAVFSTQIEPTDPRVIAAIEKELRLTAAVPGPGVPGPGVSWSQRFPGSSVLAAGVPPAESAMTIGFDRWAGGIGVCFLFALAFWLSWLLAARVAERFFVRQN